MFVVWATDKPTPVLGQLCPRRAESWEGRCWRSTFAQTSVASVLSLLRLAATKHIGLAHSGWLSEREKRWGASAGARALVQPGLARRRFTE